MPTSMKMGLLMVEACPGCNISNYLVHRSGGNTALSITMTSISTLFSVILTPFMFFIYTKYLFKMGSDVYVNVDMVEMIWILLQLILIPLTVGFRINHFFSNPHSNLFKI